MSHKTKYSSIKSFMTKDGSEIRELMHPSHHAAKNQSLAEAIVAVGEKTQMHQHIRSEELYHITHGRGRMTLAEEQFDVSVGDTVCIVPGTPHCIENIGEDALHILCMCSPAYSHEDTELL